MLELHTLGSVDLLGTEGEEVSGVLSQPKRLALLVYLAVEPGPHRRDTLLTLFWPESDETHARNALSQSLTYLRHYLSEDAFIGRRSEQIRMAAGALQSDVEAFDTAIRAGRWATALDLYKGDFLRGFHVAGAWGFEEWAEEERQRLRKAAARAAWSLAQEQVERGALVEARRTAEKALGLVCADESPVREFMSALAAAGDRAAALKFFESYCAVLRRELELEPSPATMEVVEAIRNGEEDPQGNGSKAPQSASLQERPVADIPAGGEEECLSEVLEPTQELLADGSRRTGEMVAAPAWRAIPSPEPPTGILLHERPIWQIVASWAVASLVIFGASGTLTDVVGLPSWVSPIAGLICLAALPLVLITTLFQRRVSKDSGDRATAPATGLRTGLTWGTVGLVVGGAFVLLATSTVGYTAMRTLGIGPVGTLLAAGRLEARDSILLADFETRTVDSILAYTVTEAFRVDLAQSPTVKLADQAQVAEVLRLMERDPNALLDFDTARELAIREGLKAVIGGEINTVGSTFVLTVRLVVAETGEELVSDRETAANADAVIPAIERLSRKLRERIGESLKTIGQAPALIRTRTASLEALRLYTEASRARNRGGFERGVTLATDAIALDNLFGAAYRLRSICYGNMGRHQAQQIADARKAFELRERMTDFERARNAFTYHYAVTGETEKGIEALEAYLDLHPDDLRPLNNLSLGYALLGQYAKAEEVISRSFADGRIPSSANIWDNLTYDQLNQGKLEEAEETLRRWEEVGPGSYQRLLGRFELAFLRGDYEAAEGYVRQRREEYVGGRHQQATGRYLGRLALTKGKLDQGESYFHGVLEDSEAAGSVLDYQNTARETAYTHLYVRHDTTLAQETLDAALVRYPLESVELLDRRYVDFAGAYAMAGQPTRAKALLQELRDSIPQDMWWRSEPGSRVARGWIAVAEGRLEDARVEFLRLEGPRANEVQRAFALGQVYDRMEQPDSAIASYEVFLATPTAGVTHWDALWLPLVLERLGQLYEEQGDPAEAAEYHGRFVDLWADADPELQPRVEAARAALVRLQAEPTDTIGTG